MSLLRTSQESDKEVWKTSFKTQSDWYVKALYNKHVNSLQKYRTTSFKEDVTGKDVTVEDVDKFTSYYNNLWHLIPSFGIVNAVNRFILTADVPNFLPPPLRLLIMPAAVVAATTDVYKAYKHTKEAGFDESTARFEAVGRGIYQITNNMIIPMTIFSTITSIFRRTPLKTAATYGGAAAAIATSFAVSGCVRNCIETMIINARMRRKDYSGGHLQTWAHLEIDYDNPIDIALNKKYATEPTDECLDLFPNFMIAEAAPAFEVPTETGNYVGLTPTAVNEFIARDTITNQQGLVTRIPAPTPFTLNRDCADEFAEYSLASPDALARDERLGLTLPPAPVTDASINHMISQVRKLRLAHEEAMKKHQH